MAKKKKKHKSRIAKAIEASNSHEIDDYDSDYFYDDYDDILWEDECPETAQPPPQIVREVSGSRKNQELAGIALDIMNQNTLSVVGMKLYRCNEARGCFTLIKDPENFVAGVLPQEVYNKLSSRDTHEIVMKIIRNPKIQAHAEDFNANKTLLNCKNGVVDFGSVHMSPQLRPHSPGFKFTYMVNACFLENNVEVCCNAFSGFCETSLEGNEDKQTLLLEMIGYAFSDSNAGKCAFFMKGAPDSGKSVILEFLTNFFEPDDLANVPLHNLAERVFKAELYNRKLNLVGEIKGRKLSDITHFKMITGGDRVMAEFKGQEPFSFRANCKLIFCGNTLPGTTEAEATKAFANRIKVLLLNKSIPAAEQDKNLSSKLIEERDSIFTLAMRALCDLHWRNYEFTLPQDSKEFLEAFGSSENPAMTFANDCFVYGEKCSVFNTDLLSVYKRYCEENGLEPLSRNKLYALLATLPGVRRNKIRKNGEYRHGFTGMKLKQDD